MQSKLQATGRNNKTNPTSKPNKTKSVTQTQITARLQRACVLGESAGCYLLGWRYLQTREAYKQARKWMKKGCKLAHPIACNEWGSMLLNGRGGTPDVAKAQKAFTKGCKAKYGSSCYNLGLIYMLGKGTPKQPKLARSFFQKACTLRQPVACANLAFLMTRGLGGPKGTATQIKALMNKACQMGFRPACQKGKTPRTTPPSKRR
jgi:TPR repeat protein